MKIKKNAHKRGTALLIVLFMVSFLFAMVTANSNALFGLKREIKLVEQKQKAHWVEVSSKTNRPPQPAAQETNK